MSMKVHREKCKGVAIVDPYYMRDEMLASDEDMEVASQYLGNFLFENQDKSTLVHAFPKLVHTTGLHPS